MSFQERHNHRNFTNHKLPVIGNMKYEERRSMEFSHLHILKKDVSIAFCF